MSEAAPRAPLSTVELIAMVAALSALNSLSIDIMLPALPNIGGAFALANDNDRQLVIVVYVAFFGIAQLFYGPLADAFGRRSILIWSLLLFIGGAVLCVFAPRFEFFLAARALQGIGAAATRVVSVAVVRDLSSGRRMAQIMSMAMTVFMIVPIIAPAIGQLILLAAPWRWIFGCLLVYALAILAWALIRLPETLAPENRRPINLASLIDGYGQALRHRQAFGYMIASTLLAGCLFGYVASSEQIFVDVYDLGAWFPLAFASVAIAITLGTFLNARLVVRHGMRRISHLALAWFAALGAANAAFMAIGHGGFWPFIVLLALTLITFGMIVGNFNALAMEPMGHIAGTASALYGAVTAAGGAVLGGVIARHFDGTPLPFLIGMTAMSLGAIATLLWTERGRLFREL